MKRRWILPTIAAVAAFLLLLYLAAGREDDGAAPPSAHDSALTDAGDVDAVVGTYPQTDSATAVTPSEDMPSYDAAPAGEYHLALDGEGLRLFDANSGSSRLLAFDSEGGAARSTLDRVLGAEPVETGYSEDCAATFVRWAEGLTVWVVRDRFVGWSLRDDAERLTTPTGMGIGSTRSEVEDAYAIEIFESSLGLEFVAGGMAGLFGSEASSAPVTHLWAGQTCIAR